MFPSVSFNTVINRFVEWLVHHHGDRFRQFSTFVLQQLLVPLESALRDLPPWIILLGIVLVGWHATRQWKKIHFHGCIAVFDWLFWIVG